MPNKFLISLILLGLQMLCSCSAQKETTTLIQKMPLHKKFNNGISVQLIQFHPTEDNVFETLEQFGESVTNTDSKLKLERDGLLVLKMNSADLPAVIDSLGDVINENKISHGYVFDWRDIHQQEVAQDGMLISKDGVPYLIESGFLSLLARSWKVHREDGEFTYVQVVPTWHVPHNSKNLISQVRKPKQSAVFEDLEIEVLLDDDQCLLFASELLPPVIQSGPVDDGRPPMRFGEALMGAPVTTPTISIVLIESQHVDM